MGQNRSAYTSVHRPALPPPNQVQIRLHRPTALPQMFYPVIEGTRLFMTVPICISEPISIVPFIFLWIRMSGLTYYAHNIDGILKSKGVKLYRKKLVKIPVEDRKKSFSEVFALWYQWKYKISYMNTNKDIGFMDVIIHSRYILLSESVYTIRIKRGVTSLEMSKNRGFC